MVETRRKLDPEHKTGVSGTGIAGFPIFGFGVFLWLVMMAWNPSASSQTDYAGLAFLMGIAVLICWVVGGVLSLGTLFGGNRVNCHCAKCCGNSTDDGYCGGHYSSSGFSWESTRSGSSDEQELTQSSKTGSGKNDLKEEDMGKEFSYKGNDYRVDDEGNIHEDKVFGSEVGKIDKDGNFTIKTGIFIEETGRISSWTSDVYETGMFGADKDKVGEEKGICFLTTACVESKGLPDDCHELSALRHFRDSYIAKLPDGQQLISEYYKIAPAIVGAINRLPDSKNIYNQIYDQLVLKSVQLIDSGKLDEALSNYRHEVIELKQKLF